MKTNNRLIIWGEVIENKIQEKNLEVIKLSNKNKNSVGVL